MAHTEATARRFVHLSEHHHHVRQHACRLHVPVEFLALTASFANPAEDTHALLVLDHVVNYFGEQYRLAHTSPAEQAAFAAALERYQHVDGLDPGFEDLGQIGRASCRGRV